MSVILFCWLIDCKIIELFVRLRKIAIVDLTTSFNKILILFIIQNLKYNLSNTLFSTFKTFLKFFFFRYWICYIFRRTFFNIVVVIIVDYVFCFFFIVELIIRFDKNFKSLFSLLIIRFFFPLTRFSKITFVINFNC